MKSAGAFDRALGAVVRKRRVDLGLKQRHLAEALGVTAQQIAKIEAGTSRISASALFEVARALRASVSYFANAVNENRPVTDGRTAEFMRHVARLSPSRQEWIAQLVRQMADEAGVVRAWASETPGAVPHTTERAA